MLSVPLQAHIRFLVFSGRLLGPVLLRCLFVLLGVIRRRCFAEADQEPEGVSWPLIIRLRLRRQEEILVDVHDPTSFGSHSG